MLHIIIPKAKYLMFCVFPIISAHAAESYDWSGFYLGANLGYGWAESEPTIRYLDEVKNTTKLSSDMEGVVGGVQLGYNWQVKNFLVGIETDFSSADISSENSDQIANADDYDIVKENNRINSFGTLRARLGFLPADRLLAYVTGGWAYGDVDYTTYIDSNPNPSENYKYKETKSGWVVGAGLEYGVSEHVTLRAEYLYIDWGNQYDKVYSPNFYDVEYGWDTTIDVFRVGLNYLF